MADMADTMDRSGVMSDPATSEREQVKPCGSGARPAGDHDLPNSGSWTADDVGIRPRLGRTHGDIAAHPTRP